MAIDLAAARARWDARKKANGMALTGETQKRNQAITAAGGTPSYVAQVQGTTPAGGSGGSNLVNSYKKALAASSSSSHPAATPTTHYGGTGNPLNEILYSKKQYDAGNKNWAAQNAKQYYGMLDPSEAAAVHGMNTQQLEAFINSKNVPAQSGNTGINPSGYRQPQVHAPAQQSQPPRPSSGDYQSSYTGPDMDALESQLNSQYAQTQAAALQKLREALATALQGYNAQETQAHQSAYTGRNAADVAAAQNEQRTREMMANAGLTGDGQNLTLSAAQGASRLGALNDINQTEANALQDISQKRSLLQNNEAANETALVQQIGADKAAALLDLLKYGDTRAFQVDQSNYGRYRDDINQQFAEDQFDWQKQRDLADLLGVIGGQQTLAAQNQNFNQQMALADLMGTLGGQKTADQLQREWENRFNYGQAIGQFGNGQKTVQMQQLEEDRKRYGDEFAYQKARDAVQDKQWQAQFDEDVRRYGLDHALQVNAQAISRGNANADNSRAKDSAAFNRLMDIWKATGSAPPGIQGIPEGTPYGGQQSQEPANLNSIIGNINKLYVVQNDAGNPVVNNTSGLRTYIISLGLPDDQTDQLLLLYGLPTN